MSPLAGLKNLRWVLPLPRLRRGLNDCARFAGFQATTDFRLTPMGLTPSPAPLPDEVHRDSGAPSPLGRGPRFRFRRLWR